MRYSLLNWLFYGHIWIALAAASLSWQSVYLTTGRAGWHGVYGFVFFSTLSVYSLHRLLSFRRAGGMPGGRRYNLVANAATTSLNLGVGSLAVAAVFAYTLPLEVFLPIAYALPLTFFYLIPLYPGGPRLRDLPFLKMVWVALAWTLVTVEFPLDVAMHEDLAACREAVDRGIYFMTCPGWMYNYQETITRFCFTFSIALLFDTRDVLLDRKQGVRTLANSYPGLNRLLALALLGCCAAMSCFYYVTADAVALVLAYLAAIGVGWITEARRGEDFYAVYVNGLLLLPPLLLLLFLIFFGGDGQSPLGN